MHFMILFVGFAVLNVLGQFLPFLGLSCFQYCKKCVPRNANVSTKQNFLSNKKSRSKPLTYGLGAKKQILAIFSLKLHVWTLNYVDISSYFTHI